MGNPDINVVHSPKPGAPTLLTCALTTPQLRLGSGEVRAVREEEAERIREAEDERRSWRCGESFVSAR